MVLPSRGNNWLSRSFISGKFHHLVLGAPFRNGLFNHKHFVFQGALFESPHEDENDVQTISHKCKVLPLNAYTQKYGPDPKQYTSVYDNNDTFYLAGYYDPTVLQLKMEKNIPTTATTSSTEQRDDEIENVDDATNATNNN